MLERMTEYSLESWNEALRELRSDSILEQVHAIYKSKQDLDVGRAEKRAKACGCGRCFGDFKRIKSWYE